MIELRLGSRLTFDERLDAERLSEATRLLLDIEPVLGCWLDDKSNPPQWVRCENVDKSTPFSIVETEDPDKEAARFHGEDFEQKGPRLAVALLRSSQRDEVCLRMDHIAGDGWSVKEATHLLAETYSGIVADRGHMPGLRFSPRPTHHDVWEALTDQQRTAAETCPPMLVSTKWKSYGPKGSGEGMVVQVLTLPADLVAGVRAYAHARGATVNEALIAALIRSSAQLYPQKEGVGPAVSISTDTRRFVDRPEFNRIANISTTQSVPIRYLTGETFHQTLQHVVDGVKPFRDGLWNIRSAVDDKLPSPLTMRTLMRLLTFMMRVTHLGGALVTMNLGPLDDERLSFGHATPIAAYCTGPVPKYTGFPALISYYKDSLTISVSVRERWLAPEYVDRCLKGIQEQLSDAARAGDPAATPLEALGH